MITASSDVALGAVWEQLFATCGIGLGIPIRRGMLAIIAAGSAVALGAVWNLLFAACGVGFGIPVRRGIQAGIAAGAKRTDRPITILFLGGFNVSNSCLPGASVRHERPSCQFCHAPSGNAKNHDKNENACLAEARLPCFGRLGAGLFKPMLNFEKGVRLRHCKRGASF